MRRALVFQSLYKKLAVAAFAWACGGLPLSAFALTSEGTSFLVGFGEHLTSPTLSLVVTGPAGTTGTVQIPGIGSSSSFTVPAEGVVTVSIPTAAQVVGSDIFGAGVLVTTSAPVSVYALSHVNPSLDGALVLPVPALGTDYAVLTAPQSPSDGSVVTRSQFLIVSGADNTTVTIMPTTSTAAHPANTPFTITLNRLQAYQLQSEVDGSDWSGTRITSTSAIAVFAGGTCLRVPPTQGFCSHLVEQMPPISAWDSRYFTISLPTSPQGYLVRITATQDTQLSWNGTLGGVATPSRVPAGGFVDVVLPRDNYFEIVASGPILVMQYSLGLPSPVNGAQSPSPFMTLVPGVQRYQTMQKIATPALAGFQHEIGAIIQDDVSLCTLDGASLAGVGARPIGATGFFGARILVAAAGTHTLSCPRPFGAIVYGSSTDFASYGYPAGYFFSAVETPVADAGADITAIEGTLVTLDGSNSRSPTGQALTFTWSQVSPASPRVVLDTTNPARPTFVAPEVDTTTTFTFRLVVSVPFNGSVPDFVNVTVIDRSVLPPVAGCSSNVLTVADLKVELDTVASSAVTIAVLRQTLTHVESALESKNLKVARLGMVLFVGEVVVRSDLGFAKAHLLGQDDANRLICGAANVLTKIQP